MRERGLEKADADLDFLTTPLHLFILVPWPRQVM